MDTQTIAQTVSKLLTRENITLALSVFGSLGTLITFVSSFLHTRKNLKIKVSKVGYRNCTKIMLISLTFENRSRLPISITSISVLINGAEIIPETYPKCVEWYSHMEGKEVVDRKFLYNLNFPVDVQPLFAVSGHILLDVPLKEIEKLSTPLILKVHSTRGRAQEIEFPHNQIEYYNK